MLPEDIKALGPTQPSILWALSHSRR